MLQYETLLYIAWNNIMHLKEKIAHTKKKKIYIYSIHALAERGISNPKWMKEFTDEDHGSL